MSRRNDYDYDPARRERERRVAELALEIAELARELNERTEQLRKELGHWRHQDDSHPTPAIAE